MTSKLSPEEAAALDAAGLQNAFHIYTATETELIAAWHNGTLTPKLEDDLIDRLERLWWLLTDEEQEIVRTRG